MNDMKLYMVSTYQKGDIIVYAKNKSEVKDFLSAPVQMDSLQRQQIDGFRIDRWLKTIFHGL